MQRPATKGWERSVTCILAPFLRQWNTIGNCFLRCPVVSAFFAELAWFLKLVGVTEGVTERFDTVVPLRLTMTVALAGQCH